MAFMPTSNLGVPWQSGFAMKYVNYTIIVVPVAMIALWVYWHVSVKKWFTGPRQTIDMTDEELAKGHLTGRGQRRGGLRPMPGPQGDPDPVGPEEVPGELDGQPGGGERRAGDQHRGPSPARHPADRPRRHGR